MGNHLVSARNALSDTPRTPHFHVCVSSIRELFYNPLKLSVNGERQKTLEEGEKETLAGVC